jgi:predicted small metal-binding protein
MLRKIRTALNKGIDGLGDASTEGTTVMGELITVALKDDVIGTLRSLAPYMPKDLNVDVNHSHAAKALTDDELADIIAQRARLKHDERVIEGETIDKLQLNQEVKVTQG